MEDDKKLIKLLNEVIALIKKDELVGIELIYQTDKESHLIAHGEIIEIDTHIELTEQLH